jgi:hypothetical protein
MINSLKRKDRLLKKEYFSLYLLFVVDDTLAVWFSKMKKYFDLIKTKDDDLHKESENKIKFYNCLLRSID